MTVKKTDKRGQWAKNKTPEEVSAIMKKRAEKRWRMKKYRANEYRKAHAQKMVDARKNG